MAQPTAPYDVAQAIVVQGHALNTANARIQELEAAGARPAASWPWGLLADAFTADPAAAAKDSLPMRRKTSASTTAAWISARISNGSRAGV